MGMCKPSGGISKSTGRLGSLNRYSMPNTRIDLYDENGNLIQQRWFGPDGWVVHNRDYNHGTPRPHDHYWVWNDKKGPQRSKEHSAVDNNFC